MSGKPKDPFGVIAEVAISAHEIFISYVKAGFTREEALKIIIALTEIMMTKNPIQPEEDKNE